ncbi:Pantothenate transporter liz1 [Lasiodiplodia theobromae]|uniref:Pantothenate transporter liz1 n=1 Tax=Lasiodiplodia theobromae TaxID=45133 RepID=A0A5N5DMX7_9PEZI|nr:Pantothenate transporter liz1 [Lasiodiplodia theobromae]
MASTPSSSSSAPAAEEPKPATTTTDAKAKKSFRSFIWDTDTHLKSHAERVLLRKLDWAILSIGCLGFFLKYLDQGNLANAYVSGMQEDLRMWGNEYTYAGTAYTCAYAVMQIPSTLVIQRIRPSYWLAAMEVAWGAFTFAQAGLRNSAQLYCMTVPVGLATFFILPDTPYTTRAWFLTEEECELSVERVRKAGKAAPVKITLNTFVRILSRWRWYAFVLGYVASSYFGIWLKSEHYSVVDRNIIPTGTNLISATCVVLWGFLSDYTGSRFAFVVGPLTYGLIPNGILAFWPSSIQVKEFAFLTCGVQLMTAVFYTWANEICAGDNEERALVISSMNGMQYAVAAWLPIVIFPQTMAPDFRYGFPATFGFVIAGIIVIIGIQLLALQEQRRAKATSSLEQGSTNGEEAEETEGGVKGVVEVPKQ